MSIISFCILPVLQIHQSHHLSFKHYAPCFRSSFTPITAVAKVQRRAINYPRPAPLMKKKKIETNLKVNIVAEGRGPVTEGKMNILSNPQRKMPSDHLNRTAGRGPAEGDGRWGECEQARGAERGRGVSFKAGRDQWVRTREAAVKRRKNLSDVYVHVLYMCIYLDTKG